MNVDKNPSKENSGSGFKKQVPQYSKIPGKISGPSRRDPLSALSENVPLSQNAVRISKASNDKKNQSEKKIVRSKSTSGVTQVKSVSKLRKVAATQVAPTLLAVRKNLFNVLVPPETIITSESADNKNLPNKRSRKLTLEVKLSKRTWKNKSSLFQIQELFANDSLYNEEYFSENYKYMVTTEKKLVHPRMDLLRHIDYKQRITAVTLLFQLQHSLKSSGTTLFTALRMFDNFLVKAKISRKEYELLGLTCFWIASKFQNCQTVLAPKLATACRAKYSKYEIIAMEKIILKTLKFKIKFPEQSTFLYYFLKDAQLETDSKVLLGAMFLLELFTYLIEFSSYSSLRLVAVALYLTLVQYNMNCDGLLQYIYSHVTQEVIFNKIAKSLDFKIKQLIKTKSVSGEVIAKYSKDEELNVVQYFTFD